MVKKKKKNHRTKTNTALQLQLASVTWFSLWSAGSLSPLRSAGPQWPAVGMKQDF